MIQIFIHTWIFGLIYDVSFAIHSLDLICALITCHLTLMVAITIDHVSSDITCYSMFSFYDEKLDIVDGCADKYYQWLRHSGLNRAVFQCKIRN